MAKKQQQPQQSSPTEVINVFAGGMNSDYSSSYQPPNTYTSASNARLVTDEGTSNGALTNVKGTDYSIAIPKANAVWKIHCDIQSLFNPGTVLVSSGTMVIVKAGGSTTTVNLSVLWDGNPPSFYKAVEWGLKNSNAAANKIEWYNNGNFIKLRSTSSNDIQSITFSGIGAIPNLTASQSTAAIDDLHIIGSTEIREDIYLFTARGDEIESLGQIWKLDYKETKTTGPLATNPTIDLVYTGALDFTKEHPIQAVGNYENDKIGRLFWTDNHNPPRTLNVYSENCWAFDEAILEITPDAQFRDMDILDVTAGGNLKVGSYQYAYRYISENGGVTRFSPTTPWVHVVKGAEHGAAPFWLHMEGGAEELEYNGTRPVDDNGEAVYTDKMVDLGMRRLDNRYQYVEMAVLHRTTGNGTPTVSIIEKTLIPKKESRENGVVKGYSGHYYISPDYNNSFRFLHTGREITRSISMEEFLSSSVAFKKVKSIAIKDTRLFYSNIELEDLDLTFNARAYRYMSDGSTYVSADGITAEPEDLDWDIDAVNPHNENFLDDITLRYQYQSNGTTLGGTGVNVSYEIITDRFVNGHPPNLTDPIGPFEAGKVYNDSIIFKGHRNGRAVGGPNYYSITGGNIIVDSSNKGWKCYKNPLNNAYGRGYMSGEVYRFGIVLYDKKGNPSFTNWIGDIKFPWVDDISRYPEIASWYNRKFAGVTVRKSAHEMRVWGIRFNVNIPTDLRDKISGYTIVRVRRRHSDMGVLGNGLVIPLAKVLTDTDAYNDSTQWNNSKTNKDTLGCCTSCGGAFNCVLKIANKTENDSWATTDCGCNGNAKHLPAGEAFAYVNPYFQYYRTLYNSGDLMKVEAFFDVITHKDTSGGIDDGNARWFLDLDNNGTEDDMFARYASPGDHPFGSWKDKFLNGTTFEIFKATPVLPGQTLPEKAVASYECMSFSNTAGWPSASGQTASIGGRTHIISLMGTFSTFPHYPQIWNRDGGTMDNVGLTLGQDPTGWSSYSGTGRIMIDRWDGYHSGLGWLGYNSWNGGNNLDISQRNRKTSLWYLRQLEEQYGGNLHSNRLNNVYQSCGLFVAEDDIDSPGFNLEIYGGDTYVAMYGNQILEANNGWSSDGACTKGQYKTYRAPESSGDCGRSLTYGAIFPVMTSLNIDLRRGYHFTNKLSEQVGACNTRFDEYLYEDVYSTENDIYSFYPKPTDVVLNQKFDTRTYYSEGKINGESTNSWAIVKHANFKDVDSVHGPINNIIAFRDNIYFYQDTATGILQINPVSMISPEGGSAAIQLGKGDVINDFQYLSDEVGAIHQWGIVKSDSAIYWYDGIGNKVCRFTGKGIEILSDSKGLKGYFGDNYFGSIKKQDNPLLQEGHGVIAAFDHKHSEVLFTLKDEQGSAYSLHNTVVFSEAMGVFTSFYSSLPKLYISMRDKLISVPYATKSSSDKLWLHNIGNYGEWYGTIDPCTVRFVVNPHPMYTKVFDNFEWSAQVNDYVGGNVDETFDMVGVFDDSQVAIPIDLSDLRLTERIWRVPVGRSSGGNERIRDKYMNVVAVYNNQNLTATKNNRLRLHLFRTKFRLSRR